ncbi:MAG: RsmE family RNA methyltransferase [Anaeroplasma sp.]
MQKYFIDSASFENKIINGDDAFHIKSVMRMRVGDEIIVSSMGKSYQVKLSSIANDEVSFEVIKELIGNVELPVFVSIFQGYPKGDKIEDIIKHGTELGACEFVPTLMKRSIFKLDSKKKDNKLIRLNKIAKEAAEQSFRDIVPSVKDILSLKSIDFKNFDIKIVCYEENAKNKEISNFKSILTSLKAGQRVAVVIGPEGGIDSTEISYLESLGFRCCSLGPRILRTETAVFYVLSSISYEMELKK